MQSFYINNNRVYIMSIYIYISDTSLFCQHIENVNKKHIGG